MAQLDQETSEITFEAGHRDLGRILVPLDGSERAESVLGRVGALAGSTGSTVTLLGVVLPLTAGAPAWSAAMPAVIREEEFQAAGDDLRAYLRGVQARLIVQGLRAEAEVREGDPAAEIVACAQIPSTKLIAMATHGRGGLGRWVFGSVAEAVLHAAPVPLLLVHDRSPSSPTQSPGLYRTILVPLDGSAFAEQALAEAQALAMATGAGLLLVAAVPENLDPNGPETHLRARPEPETAAEMEAYLERQAARLETADLTVDTYLAFGAPAETILQVSDAAGADMIVMATHGRTGFQKLRMGSVALKVVHRLTRPILLVRASEPALDHRERSEVGSGMRA